MKRLCFCLLACVFAVSLYAQDIAKIKIEDYKLDARITSILADESGNDAIYQQNNNIYALGWSKDGKLAFIENREIEGRGGHDFFFTIQDMVEDEACYYKVIIGYDGEVDDPEGPGMSFEECIRANAGEFNQALKKYGIVVKPLTVSLLPALDRDGNSVSFHINILKEAENEFCLTEMTYELIATKNGKSKSLGTVKDKICNYVMPTAYLKSPYEDRIALIVADSEHVFEGSEVFVQFYGCNLRSGFSKK
ncbi:MAG: hypothetical protein J6Y13_02590 [Treponema sp.]|nr:hypothetical protein [Treponema sp.]